MTNAVEITIEGVLVTYNENYNTWTAKDYPTQDTLKLMREHIRRAKDPAVPGDIAVAGGKAVTTYWGFPEVVEVGEAAPEYSRRSPNAWVLYVERAPNADGSFVRGTVPIGTLRKYDAAAMEELRQLLGEWKVIIGKMLAVERGMLLASDDPRVERQGLIGNRMPSPDRILGGDVTWPPWQADNKKAAKLKDR